MPGPLEDELKYAIKYGWFQCVTPGVIILSTSERILRIPSPSSGGESGNCFLMSPGLTHDKTVYPSMFSR